MNAPRFSVCVPTYNRAASLPKAVESVFAQDYENYEVVVLDNASTDDTASVLATFADPRLVVHRNSCTVSMYENHNRCIRAAASDWIVFLHSDDHFTPGTLSGFASAIQSEPSDVKVFISRTTGLGYTAIDQRFGGTDALEIFLRHGFAVPTGNAVAKSLYTESNLYYDPAELFADALFLLRVSLETTARIRTVPGVEKVWDWTGTSRRMFASYDHIASWNPLARYLRDACSRRPALLAELAARIGRWTPDEVSHLLFRLGCAGWHEGVATLAAAAREGGVSLSEGRYYKHVWLIDHFGVAPHRAIYRSVKALKRMVS